MLLRNGPLHLTRRFAKGLGLRCRALRAEIDGWMAERGPLKGQVLWAGRNRLVLAAQSGPLLLDLDGTQLPLIFAALHEAQEGTVSSTRQAEYFVLRNRLTHALPVTLRALVAQANPSPAPGLGGEPPAALAAVLAAFTDWRRLRLRYEAASGAVSDRVVWPIVLHYKDSCLIAWCELRGEQRSFRLDRMQGAEVLPDSPPKTRAELLAQWDETRWQD